jgi:hypothetical protein
MLIFDIETRPLPNEELRQVFVPPEPPEWPGEFDPGSVALGNMKDPEKIEAKIASARRAHQKALRGHEQRTKELEEAAWQAFRDGAALSAATGMVLVVGYYSTETEKLYVDHGLESEVVARFWRKAEVCRQERRTMVGLNIHDFDLPFLMRRAWLLGVGHKIPSWALNQGRYWDSIFVDLRKIWLCGQWGAGQKSNFDLLGKAFGTGGKPEGVNGSMFAEMWETDRPAALDYLEQDLRQPAVWAERMGIT